MGVIDILTNYGTAKKFENLGKSIVHDSNAISCVPPSKYGERFFTFMDDRVFVKKSEE